MQRPSWKLDPRMQLGLALATMASLAGGLAIDYSAGTWVPSGRHVLAGLCGLVLVTAGFILPRLRAYHRDPDGHVRLLLAGERFRGDRVSGVVCVLLGLVALDALGQRNFLSPLMLCYLVGAMFAVVLASPHSRAVWKRMWELYESESRKPVVPPPPMAAVVPGGQGEQP